MVLERYSHSYMRGQHQRGGRGEEGKEGGGPEQEQQYDKHLSHQEENKHRDCQTMR